MLKDDKKITKKQNIKTYSVYFPPNSNTHNGINIYTHKYIHVLNSIVAKNKRC